MKQSVLKVITFSGMALSITSSLHAQIKIGGTIGAANANALLQLGDSTTNKGLLLPRVALTATNAASPLSANIAGMTVYNTATAGTAPNNVVPGFYYNDGTQWIRIPPMGWLLTGNSGTDSSINFVGTTDNKPLMFRVNNTKAGIISTAYNNTGFGYQALLNIKDSAQSNTAFGYQALMTFGTAGSGKGNNTAVGDRALTNTVSSCNTAVGSFALGFFKGATSSISGNTAVGYLSLEGNATITPNTGIYNCAFGVSALNINESGSYNVVIGYSALSTNKSGSYNTAIGSHIGSTSTGSNNILIGGSKTNTISPSDPTANYEMNIGNTLFGTLVDTTIGLGRIGINTRTPQAALDVQGSQAGSITVTALNPYTAASTDYIIILTTASATLTLPAANSSKGRNLIVRTVASGDLKLSLTATSDTITDYSGSTYTGTGTFTITGAGPTGLKLVSDGSNNWYAIP